MGCARVTARGAARGAGSRVCSGLRGCAGAGRNMGQRRRRGAKRSEKFGPRKGVHCPRRARPSRWLRGIGHFR
nr:hypothetical protein RVX_2608 [Nitratidesulfovibrio sp. HK-II]